MALELSKVGYEVSCGVYWPQAERKLSDNLQYIHIDKLKASDYDIVFCHLVLSVQQLWDLSQGTPIARGPQIYGNSAYKFKEILEHPRKYLQLDAPRPLHADPKVDINLVMGFKCIGVATQNAVPIWKNMYPKTNVEWVNAATIAYKYVQGPKSPFPSHDKPNIIYLGRMNDASAVPPIEKMYDIAARLPEYNFHIVTNKIRDGRTDLVYAINELQSGSGRELRFHDAQKLIKLPNIFLHRGSTYDKSFDWMHYADCAIGFTVRPKQDVASCKSWEYYGCGVPVVLEEDTPETWILDQIPAGEVAKYGNWDDFAQKIKLVVENPDKYKRRKTRKYIAENHGYDSRAKQWKALMEKCA
jgi:glycosyltransferase involved in cell wall biosynthesis